MKTTSNPTHKVTAPLQRAVGDWRRVADALQADIILGRLFPRQRLIEDEVMARFDTTRHAVRSAFDELQRRGLIAREANRGAFVRSYSAQEVEELFEILEVLEAHAIRRMPLPASPALVRRLAEVQKQHRAASERDEYLELFRLNKVFHDTLFDACGNEKLAQLIRDRALLIDPIRMRRIPDLSWRREAVRHHADMVKLLQRGDREALVTLCAAHVEPTKAFYLSLYAAGSAPAP